MYSIVTHPCHVVSLEPKLVLMSPSGEDLEMLSNRNDDKFSQKVRNIKSHKTLENKGYAKFYDDKFFITEKDVQELARVIAKERSRREIKPVIKVLDEVSSIKDDGTEKTKELIKQTKVLHNLTKDADAMINKLMDQKQNWLTKSVFKLLK